MMDKLTTGFEVNSVNDQGHFEGYASVFDVADQGRDIVERGAFKRTIADRGPAGIKMLWQHDPSEPIGVLDEIYEDSHGLFVKGRLLMDVKRAHEAHALIVEGCLDGLSIGFKTVRARRDEANGHRHLLDLDLWEVSLVTFPMQPSARISKFTEGAHSDIPGYQAFLENAGGLSPNEAAVLATKGFNDLENNDTSPKDYGFRFIVVPLFLLLSPILVVIGMIIDKYNGESDVVVKNLKEAPGVFKEAFQYIFKGKLQ